MANHKSAIKRNRSNEAKHDRNRYQAKTVRNAIRDLRITNNKGEAEKMLPNVSALVDKLAKVNVIHKNKAANLKSKLATHVANL